MYRNSNETSERETFRAVRELIVIQYQFSQISHNFCTAL